jgi:tetratricopeptide (TPR) repeat protein
MKQSLGVWANIVAVVGALVAGYFWLDARVKNEVAERVEPYERLLNGIALVQDESEDFAVTEFRLALDTLEEQGIDEERLHALINFYLYAVVNSTFPKEFSPDFKRAKDYIGGKIPKYAWHLHQLAWWELRTGDLTKAESQFKVAIPEFNEEYDYRGASYPYWGLTLVYLARGELDNSIEQFVLASESNPQEFNILDFIRDIKALRKEEWFDSLERKYPKITATLPEFIQGLSKRNDL